MQSRISITQRLAFVGIATSLLFILSYVENMIPLNFSVPGVKIGLSNIVILLFLYLFTFKYAFFITIMKIIIQSLVFGSVSAILFTTLGSFASLFSMAIFKKLFRDKISSVGVSVIGGFFHISFQYISAYLILNSSLVFKIYPYSTLLTLLTSIAIGYFSLYIIRRARFEKSYE